MLEPRVIIDINSLIHNARELIKSAPGEALFPVLKANAYGHGSVLVAQAYEKHFTKSEMPYFCVARFGEARELRRQGVQRPLLVLSHFADNDLATDSASEAIDVVVNSWQDLDLLANSKNKNSPMGVHINLNSGMNRLGFSLPLSKPDRERLLIGVAALKRKGHSVCGIMTHLARGEEESSNGSLNQLEQFYQELTDLHSSWEKSQHGSWPQWRHAENSGGLSRHLAKLTIPVLAEIKLSAARPGLHLWGVAASPDLEIAKKLRPVMQVAAPMRQIHVIKPGESVGYGAYFTAQTEMVVGTVCLGYADGVSRKLSTKKVGEHTLGFIVAGERVSVLGRVSMDMTAVDLTRHSQVERFRQVAKGEADLGAELAHWIGPGQSALEIADFLGTISYEVFCSVNFRIPRIALGEVS